MKYTHLRVATLNFAGINSSPFQYHDGSPQMQAINQIFLENLKHQPMSQVPDFKWDLGRIDILIKAQRYSPLYRSNVGIAEDGKLMSWLQFQSIWRATLDKAKQLFSAKNKPSPQQVDVALRLDWLVYLTILMYVYGRESFDLSKIRDYDSKLYGQFLHSMHSKPFLKSSSKTEQLRNYLQHKNVDVLFLQEALTTINWNVYTPPDYKFLIRDQGSAVFYKKSKISVDRDEAFENQYGEKLNFNNDSLWLKCNNGSLLLISAHLTSKPKRFEQCKQMQQQLIEIVKAYPDMTVIVGIDANQDLEPFDKFEVFPPCKKAITTSKKRTFLQAQFHKSDVLIQQAKDYILSNKPLTKGVVETIKQEKCQNRLLPNSEHPFDHFVVCSQVEYSPKWSRPKSPQVYKKKMIMISPKVRELLKQDFLNF